ncbi:hypothetical protein H8S95_09675 [Pontibacter sp. KCTC 32443]|uniref:hypothetical protein n=1 Tax=Pontibacter TaxID=323449 RepID=UPI00164D6D43|nr:MULTISPECIES: hypothetical protein [Pontibacter]MBC5774328.1 hypothetical protein [Pontibacter sp. KCTC 32443]
MKRLDKPADNAEDVFLTCVNIIRKRDLKTRLLACKDLITEAADEFTSKIANGEAHKIKEETIVNGNVTAKELEKVYTYRFARKDTPGRLIYDKLITAPKFGVCPLCSHRLVETLDHYLPKSKFPRLAVVPLNLIPSCTDCNKSKLAISPKDSDEETLHPYYDDIENDIWLVASVEHTSPPVVKYRVEPNPSWPALLGSRVKHHFSSLYLDRLYSTQAAVQLAGIVYRLDKIFKSAGAAGVKLHLEEEALSRFYADKNSWQTAMYKALAEDAWFCNGGFRI